MTEADVVYSEVKFVKSKGDTIGAASSPAETTRSEVRILKTEPSTELSAGSQQQAVSNGGSKVPSERVAIAILSVLLAAAVIALVFTSYEYFQTMERLHQLTAVNKNLTEGLREENTSTEVQKTCPAFVNTTQPCSNCQEGWKNFGRQCYYFSDNSSQWEKARDDCQHQGGDLVRIDSKEEQSFLQLNLREKMEKDEDKFWIGLRDTQKEGTWLWGDGSPLDESLTFWGYGQPDDWQVEDRDGEDCVRMGEKAESTTLKSWFDRSCKIPHRSICEKAGETGHLLCA